MASKQIFAILLLFAGVLTVSGKGVIDPSLESKFLFGGGGSRQNVMVSFDQSLQTVFDRINAMNFTSIFQKRSALTNAQKAFTRLTQGPLQTLLNFRGARFESFWISNKMIVSNANRNLINFIANAPGVARVEKEPVVNINLPFVEEPENLTRETRQGGLMWGIEKIRAHEVWDNYKGRGIVIANIDTGVRHTHETLEGRWRSSYGWYDPYRRTREPNDQNGHGTHTMGTIAGTNGIGVAPEATWIACKGCNSDSCGGRQLYACGEWIQCPTDYRGRNPDCDQAPDIVSNSWGGGGGSTWYDEVLNSWRESGIIPVVSIGNSGPRCDTAGSPGDRPQVIGVGSTDSEDRISSFSSLGPATDGRVKPDIVAPGSRVRSAWHRSDRSYSTISGTSMSCPHVSGVIGLMLEKNRNLDYNQIYKAITQTAATRSLDTSDASNCGGVSSSSFPNNVFGHGRIDAVDAVDAV